MSTRAVRRLALLCKNEGFTPEVVAMGEEALAELEAIRNAARVLAAMRDREWSDIEVAAHLIESIAEEAP